MSFDSLVDRLLNFLVLSFKLSKYFFYFVKSVRRPPSRNGTVIEAIPQSFETYLV